MTDVGQSVCMYIKYIMSYLFYRPSFRIHFYERKWAIVVMSCRGSQTILCINVIAYRFGWVFGLVKVIYWDYILWNYFKVGLISVFLLIYKFFNNKTELLGYVPI